MRVPGRFASILIVCCACVSARAAEDPEIALQRQLDQPLSLSLSSVQLSEAFKQIAAAAKVPLQIDPACYELLPYGETTRVSVDFKQSKLRDALDEVLIPLSLQKTVSATAVMIKPSAPLKRAGRRAEWEELKLLKDLYSSDDLKLPAATGSGPAKFSMAEAIRAAMEGRKDLTVVLTGDANGTLSPAQERALDQIAKQLPMTAYRALETYCQLTGDVWCVEAGPLAGGPSGGRVLIMTSRQWIARQLERPIKISRTNEPLEVVVVDLAHASGIHFVPSAGLYQAVPAVNLKSDNATVLQTLEFLAGGTGIAFEIRDDSIFLYKAEVAGGPAPARNDQIIGRISVPVGDNGPMMDLFLRESDLTAEQREAWQKYLQQARERILKNGISLPVSPALAPATAPAAGPATQVKE